MKVKAWAASDVGNVKKHNEDNFFVDTTHRVFVVADGVSGRNAGEVASKDTVDYFETRSEELAGLISKGNPLEDDTHRERVLQELTEIVQSVNTLVYEKGKQPEYHGGMATTVVSLVLGQHAGFVAHVGDSRIYLRRDDKIFRITEDHTYAEELRKYGGEQQLPASVNERFSHVLTRSIGGRPRVDVDVVFFELQPGDCFLLCSDGLTDYLSGSELLDFILNEESEDLVDVLVDEAKDRGGRDNITALYVQLMAGEEGADEMRRSARLDTLRKINFLNDMQLFQDLAQIELLKILRVIYEQVYTRGDLVIQQGERSAAIYLIVEGAVAVSRDGKHLATLKEGEHFGELSLFESSASSVSVHAATEETLLLAIPLQQFKDFIADDLALGNRLLWNVLRQLARHMEQMNERIVDAGVAKTLELRAISRAEVPGMMPGAKQDGDEEAGEEES